MQDPSIKILLLSLLIFQLSAQSNYSNTIFFSSKTSYNISKPHFQVYLKETNQSTNGIATLNQPPSQCKAKQLSLLVRHGTRYPSDGDVEKIDNIIAKLQNLDLKAPFVKVKDWNNTFTLEQESLLADAGKEEMKSIASKYTSQFPNLFSSAMSKSGSENVEIISSEKERTESSAKAFVDGVSEEITVDVMNLNSKINIRNDLIRFYDFCTEYIDVVDSDAAQEKSLIEFHKFIAGPEMQEAAKRVSAEASLTNDEDLFTTEELEIIWLLCGFERAMKGADYDSPWCYPITIEDSLVLEYANDIETYWLSAYGYKINYQQSCPLFSNIVDNFQQIIASSSAPAVSLYFGHSGTVLPIYSLLGLFDDGKPLNASNFSHNKNGRKLRSSIIGPFAANIGFSLYECEEGVQTSHPDWPEKLESHMLQIMVNEQVVQLPFTDKVAVTLSKFEKQYDWYTSQCDFDKICKNDNPTSTSPGMTDRKLAQYIAVCVSFLAIYML